MDEAERRTWWRKTLRVISGTGRKTERKRE